MNIEVRVLTGRTVQYYMSPESRVIDLQNKIAEREGLAPDSQYIIVGQRNAKSEERLGEIGMQECTKVHLLSRVAAGMNVKVRDINGSEITVEIEKNKTTVRQLKAEIEDKRGIAVGRQILVMCDGQTEIEMRDRYKVIDYIKEEIMKTYTISLLIKEQTRTLEPLNIEEPDTNGSFLYCCLASCSIL